MTGTFAGAASFFFLSASSETGNASVTLNSTSQATAFLRLRFGFAPGFDLIDFLLTVLRPNFYPTGAIFASDPYGSPNKMPCCSTDLSPEDRVALKNAADGTSGNRSWKSLW